MRKEKSSWGIREFLIVGCFAIALIFGTLYVSDKLQKPKEVIREVVNNTVQVVYVNVTQPAQVVQTPQQNITVAYMTQISAQKLNNKDHPCSSCGEWQGTKMVMIQEYCYEDAVVMQDKADSNTLLVLKSEWYRQCRAGNKQACWYYNHCLWCGGMNKDGTGQVWCADYNPV